MFDEPYNLYLPFDRTTAVVFASPHSGRNYDLFSDCKTDLDDLAIRSSEDAFVDELFALARDVGAPFLTALAPRAFVDLNRDQQELDPALIEGAGSQKHNPRIASGLGVIPRVVSGGRAIYNGKLRMEEASDRISHWWHPYHRKLQRLLDESLFYYGHAILIDCHSMPGEALENVQTAKESDFDIVLGDRFGSSASPAIVEAVETAFRAQGFSVARNSPFAGAFITQRYGVPKRNQHAVQVEVNRRLYMDEQSIERLPEFESVKARISNAVKQIAEIGRSGETSLAAE